MAIGSLLAEMVVSLIAKADPGGFRVTHDSICIINTHPLDIIIDNFERANMDTSVAAKAKSINADKYILRTPDS